MIGQVVLKKYRILRLLDQGGMSDIFLARQLDQNRDVVVKVLQEPYLAQLKTREHFRREIHICSRFKHPHAVGYVDSSADHPGGPVLVLEFLRGIDLHGLLQREGRLTVERAGRLLAQLCDVLQAAHDAGIVHRDIKPGNLMILQAGTPQETLKLMDFGLAKMSNVLYIAPEELIDYRLPPAAGTPEYISPEQVRGSDMDGRGDLYSVGVVLYEMLTGRRPFNQPVVADLLSAHANQKPPTFAEMGVTDIAPAIEQIVRSCLEKFPDQRPGSAQALAQRYEQALGRRLTIPRAAVPPPGRSRQTMMSRPTGSTANSPRPSTPIPGNGAFHHSIEAVMPEAMALIKLKGFIFDLGGEVVDSVPGTIKVRVPEPERKTAVSHDSRGGTAAPASIDLELHMERAEPSEANKLTITLVISQKGGFANVEWKTHCQRLAQELQAYLMGR